MMGGWFVATAIGNKLTVIGTLWTQWYHSSFWLLCSLSGPGHGLRPARAHAAAEEGHAGRLMRIRSITPLTRNDTMRLLLALLIMLMAASPLWAAGRPMTVDDLLAVKAVSDPQVSPDGKLVVYVVSELDRATDKTNSDLWLVPVAGRRAEAADDRARDQQPPPLEPRRQDDRLRLEPRRLVPGLALADRRRRGPPADQAADRRLRARSGRPRATRSPSPPRSTPARPPRRPPRRTRRRRQSKSKVRIYDHLMIRHWNDLGRGEAEPPLRRRRARPARRRT